MADDTDKLLAEVIDHLNEARRAHEHHAIQRGHGTTDYPAGLLAVIPLAEVLAVTRRELAETRRLVDALAGPTTVVHGPVTWCAAEGRMTFIEHAADPRPIKPTLTEPHRCDDCHSPIVALASRRCARCQERDALKAALRSACELLDPHARSDADLARIAELRRLL